jgi:KDO2-lipid IV(A) lauroyltransferase
MQFARSLAESLALSRCDRYQPQVDIEGVEPLLRVLAAGQGAVVATAHSAGWEIALGALCRAANVPVTVAMLAEREGAARSYHPEVGSERAVDVVTVGDDPLCALPLLSRLRGRGVVAVQTDRCPASMRALEVRIDRTTWRLPAGPFVLAATAGVPICLVLSRRVGFLHYSLLAHEPVVLPRRATDNDLLEAARDVARQLTAFVRRYPDQWFDFAPRW